MFPEIGVIVAIFVGVPWLVSLVLGGWIFGTYQDDPFGRIVGLFVFKSGIATPIVFFMFGTRGFLEQPARLLLPGALLTALLIAAGHRELLAHRAGALLLLGGDLLRWLPLPLLRLLDSSYIFLVWFAIAAWTVAYAFLCRHLVRSISTAGVPSSA